MEKGGVLLPVLAKYRNALSALPPAQLLSATQSRICGAKQPRGRTGTRGTAKGSETSPATLACCTDSHSDLSDFAKWKASIAPAAAKAQSELQLSPCKADDNTTRGEGQCMTLQVLA